MSHSEGTELTEIADHVFRRPPGPPKSVVLQLTEESADQFIQDPTASPELELFTDIARLGVKILFGDDCNIAQLTRDQFALLQRYMHSMGVALIIRCNEDGVDPWELTESGGKVMYLRISVQFI